MTTQGIAFAAGASAPVELVRERLRALGKRITNGGKMAQCPAHDDRTPSLSISEGADGCAVLHCHADCTVPAIVAALGLEMKDLFTAREAAASHRTRERIFYTYRDESEAVLFRVERIERATKKDFYSSRPDGRGGWETRPGCLDGVRRVLFRLPELLAADPLHVVYIPEGEKDVLGLVGRGLVATTNPHGAGKWRDEYSPMLAGRHVVILPDNDEPGRAHAESIARSLSGIAASVRVLELPGLGPKGDVSDWLANGGARAALSELARNAPEWTASATSPLDSLIVEGKASGPLDAPPQTAAHSPTEHATASAARARIQAPAPEPFEPFPVNALPDVLADFVRAGAGAFGVDDAMIATAALAVLAACIGNARQIELKGGSFDYLQPAILWTANVAPSGSTKTAGLRRVLRAIYKAEAQTKRDYVRDVSAWEESRRGTGELHEAWRQRRRRKAFDPSADPEPARGSGPQPVCRRLVTNDTTIEALAPLLNDSPRGMLVHIEELAAWPALGNPYSKAPALSNAARWHTLWDAGQWMIARKASAGGPKHLDIERASATIIGGIQPTTLRRVMKPEFRELGTLGRFLIVSPPQRSRRWSDATIPHDVGDRFDSVIGALLRLSPASAIATGTSLTWEPQTVGLTADARGHFGDFYDETGRLLDEEGDESLLRSPISKSNEACARLALILHEISVATGDASPGLVEEMTMLRACVLARWYRNEGCRIWASFSESDADAEARQAHEWIRKRGGEILVRDFQRNGPKPMRTRAQAIVDDLVARGWGSVTKQASGPTGGQPANRFTIAEPPEGESDAE